MVGRRHGGFTNQAGSLALATSQWGQVLAGGQSRLIDQPLPIGTRKHNFGGTVGGLSVVAASLRPVVGTSGYFGDMPQSEQGTVAASPPWERP